MDLQFLIHVRIGFEFEHQPTVHIIHDLRVYEINDKRSTQHRHCKSNDFVFLLICGTQIEVIKFIKVKCLRVPPIRELDWYSRFIFGNASKLRTTRNGSRWPRFRIIAIHSHNTILLFMFRH